jgi:hypothetical protein
VIVVRCGVGQAIDQFVHGVPGTRECIRRPSGCMQRQHRSTLLRVCVDHEVSAVLVAERKLGEADDEVPVTLVRLVPQSRQKSVDVLAGRRSTARSRRRCPRRQDAGHRAGRDADRARTLSGWAQSAVILTWSSKRPWSFLTGSSNAMPSSGATSCSVEAGPQFPGNGQAGVVITDDITLQRLRNLARNPTD